MMSEMIQKMMKTINPNVGLGVVTKLLIEELKHPVKKYEMHYRIKEQEIDFLVFHPGPNYPEKYFNPDHSHLYKFSQAKMICKPVSYLLSKETKKGDIMDYAIVRCEVGAQTKAELYITRNGEKIKLNFTI